MFETQRLGSGDKKMPNKPNLMDIIIVNYNSTDYLLQCLRSVYGSLQELRAKVIVQDNASADDVSRVQTMFPEVVLSRNAYNMGFAKAVNQGLEESNAPYVILLNPDIHVSNGFFSFVLQYMEENPEVGIVGPKILNLDGSVQGSARSFPTPLTALFGRSTLLTKWFPKNRFTSRNVLTTRTDGNTPVAVDWVSGACMVVRRKAIDDVGPIDERFFIYWEDADWCKRMWRCGWKVVYLPRANIVHYVGGSSEKLLLRSVVEFHKSCYRLFEKHSKPRLRLAMPLVFGCLATRLLFVLFSHGVRRWAVMPKSRRTPKLGFDLEPFFSAERLKGTFRRNLGVDGDTGA
jgi:GT2 family glycosyltransferase